MKKFCFVFALFCAVVFLAACGGDSKSEDNAAKLGAPCQIDGEELCSPDDTEILICQDSVWHTKEKCKLNFGEHCQKLPSELYGCTAPQTEKEKDSDDDADSDSDDEDTDTDSDSGDDADSDSTGDSGSDDADSQPDDDTDTVSEPTNEEKCTAAGGNWNKTKKSCTKTTDCTGKPEHAGWNGDSSYTQTYTDGAWSEEIEAKHSSEAGICRYKCDDGYVYQNHACITLPACGKETASFPCYDSESGLIWSEITEDEMSWRETDESGVEIYPPKIHCKNLNKSNYGGFNNGWHLPDIDELRTLLIVQEGTPRTASCKVSETQSCLAWDACWSCETCTEEGTPATDENWCSSWYATYGYDGKYSKFGDLYALWSSSLLSGDPDSIWTISFSRGTIACNDWGDELQVRCVRDADYEPSEEDEKEAACDIAGGNWNAAENSCTRTLDCPDKPENSVWNNGGTFTQTWNGSAWEPEVSGSEYSETGGVCTYKCKSSYYYNDGECLNPCDSNPCNSIANAISGSCTASSWKDFKCSCKGGYSWTGEQCIIPECNKSTTLFPCKDPQTNYWWSVRYHKLFSDAKSHCNGLNSSIYGGFSSGWRLPTIDELKTLLVWSKANSCRVSNTTGCLTDSCWSCSTCTETGVQKSGSTECESYGTLYHDDTYSRLKATISNFPFWSSSEEPDTNRTWSVDFQRGAILSRVTASAAGSLYGDFLCVRTGN